MKKLTIGTGGHRFFPPDDLTHLNEAIVETAEALKHFFGENFYISNTSITTAGGYHSCAAGCMVYKGELCYFDAQNIADVAGKTLSWVPVLTYRALDPITYADASSKSPHVIKKVKLEMVDLGAPPADYQPYTEFKQKSTAVLDTFSADWTVIGDAGTALSGAWANVLGTHSASLRRNVTVDAINFSRDFNFKGGLQNAALTLNQDDPTTLFTVPAAFQPKRDLYGCVPMIVKINADPADDMYFTVPCKLTTAGLFIVYAPVGIVVGNTVVVYLDGLTLFEHMLQI